MRALTIEDLNAAAHIGGAGSMVMRQEFEPASGPDGMIAPAKYVDERGNATYVFVKRYEETQEKPVKTVLVDSKGSFANRVEGTTTEAMRNGEGILSKMPRIKVQYDTESGKKVFYDNQLPHRAFDGHIRVGKHNGESTSNVEEYVKARNSTLENLLPLFELSPETVIFGGWDSTRTKNQLRIPSVMVGETYAVLAEQEEDPVMHRAGGRVDPVGASVKVSSESDRKDIVDNGIDLSNKLKTGFKKDGKGSSIGLGAIPPSAKEGVLDGVSVRKVISTRVLSFATVRTFRFGKGIEGDVAIRALIIATLLRDIAGYDDNPFIRANCFLAETGKPAVVLNKRYGEKEELEPITVESAEKLLEEAYKQAREKADIIWDGQEFIVEGNPAVLANSSAEDDEKGK